MMTPGYKTDQLPPDTCQKRAAQITERRAGNCRHHDIFAWDWRRKRQSKANLADLL